jgi:acyl-CoA synthetase (AMP-forming)/AMP-acid ligase II
MNDPSVEATYLDHLRTLWRQRWPKGVPDAPCYPLGKIPLTEHLREWARRTPDKPTVIFYGREVTYAELDRLSDRFAAWLARHGVQRGDRIAVFLPNCPQFLIAFFGILKSGCVHVPVNPLFKEHELAYELNDTGAKVIVALDQLFGLVRAVKPRTSLTTVLVTSFVEMLPPEPTIPVPLGVRQPKTECLDAIDFLPAIAAIDAPCPSVAVGLDDIAALNYTGGTTGMPKGCVHTQRDMIYTAATGCAAGFALGPDAVCLNFVPVFWIAGEDIGIIFPIFSGATCVLLARWDPAAFMAAVERYRVTFVYLLVDNAVEVMDHPDAGRYDMRSLAQVRVSSFVKKLNVEYRQRWRLLTGTTMIEAAWGMTETHTCDTFTTGMQDDDQDLKSQPIFVGLPMPGTEFKICDFETGALVPLDQEGEICLRSPSLLKGYWNKEEASAAALRYGWLHTGDIGMIDHEGYLHFLGRRKEMLKVKGMSIFPAEIEALLGQHPAIVGSAVIGRPDEERGQVPVAFVRIDERQCASLTAAELTAWCRNNMATYKVPEIRIVEELPVTATGKVKKDELNRLL